MGDEAGGSPGIADDDKKAYRWMAIMGGAIIGILIVGIILAYVFKNFAMVPFAVVIMGILAFFGVLRISRALTSSNNDNEIRKSITVSIMVVYLGLLPTLAFQGLFQFQLTGNSTTDAAVINQTINQTVVQVIPTTGISETVVTSFTALVAAVLLFYFGSRTLDSYYSSVKGAKSDESSDKADSSKDGDSGCSDQTKTEKETTVAKYDKDGKLIEKTVTTERVKAVKETTETTVVIKKS